jgi:small subunit ribosomal protein S20
MANIESAKKRARQAIVRAERNAARKSRVRTMVRKAEEAIVAGDRTVAAEAVRIAQKELMHGVTKGILHIRTASRKVSRLNLRVNAL